MTLPTSGPITLNGIATEFNQPTSDVRLKDYYAGAGKVPVGTMGYPNGIAIPIPASGPISLQNFYGSRLISIVALRTSGDWQVPAGVTSVTLLMAAGGGGGGSGLGADGGGGGGAGGISLITGVSVSPGAFIPVVIGAGGAGNSTSGAGSDGTRTSFNGFYPQTGGGGGGGSVGGQRAGRAGGSGGGACGYGGANAGGTATISGTTGYNGGSAGRYNSGGGGGGRSAVGQSTADQDPINNIPGKGGAALEVILPANSSISPWSFYSGLGPSAGAYGMPYSASSIKVGGGGGGGKSSTSAWAGVGGSAIGGNGGISTSIAATSGAEFTGSGGGGGYADASTTAWAGGNGGSGIIYVIYSSTAIGNGPLDTFDSAISTNDFSFSGATVTSGIMLSPDGTITAINTAPGGSPIARNSVGTNWYSTTTAGIGSSYWAYVSRSGSGSGNISNYGSFDTWVNLGTSQTWSLSSVGTASGAIQYWAAQDKLTISIANSSGGATVATATILLSVISNDSGLVEPPPDIS